MTPSNDRLESLPAPFADRRQKALEGELHGNGCTISGSSGSGSG